MARIAGIDIPREKRLEIALTYIYGIGRTTSKQLIGALDLKTPTEMNGKDPKWARREFIKSKLAFLAMEIKFANNAIKKGIPMEPWLSKAINWATAVWPKLRDLWKAVKGGGEPADPNKPGEPSGGDKPLDINELIGKLDKKLAAIDQQLYDLVNAECRL